MTATAPGKARRRLTGRHRFNSASAPGNEGRRLRFGGAFKFTMGKTRAPYPAAFRQQLIELVEAGRTPAELSREFGVTAQTIANWVGQAAIDKGKPLPGKEGLTSAERAELSRLRRENRRLQTERDILAKATAWFAARGEKTSTPSSNS